MAASSLSISMGVVTGGRMNRNGLSKRLLVLTRCNKTEENSSAQKLDELDRQLEGLSSRTRDRAPRAPALPSSSESPDDEVQTNEKLVLYWPDFSGGFYWYAAGVLFLITIINNLIFYSVFPPDK